VRSVSLHPAGHGSAPVRPYPGMTRSETKAGAGAHRKGLRGIAFRKPTGLVSLPVGRKERPSGSETRKDNTMTFNPSTLLPSSCCVSLAAVIGLLASDRMVEAALTAAVCFLCVLGIGASAEEARKEARLQERVRAWPARRKPWVDTGMV